MKKLTQLLKESQHLDYRRMNVGEDEEGQGMTKEEKRAFVEAVAAYRQLGEMISHKGNISEIHDSIKGIVENANNLTLKETGDWFDRVTVQRHMKSMNESFKVFSNTIKEVSTLQQRLESSYDEIGEVLGKYYEIKEGNEFGAERAKAIANGDDSFEVDGKSYKVTGVDAEDKKNADEFANESMKLTSLIKRNEELTGKQKELDVDSDGDIEADDLADLRAGKKADESVNEERDSNLFYVLYQKKDGKFSKPQAAGYKSREDAEKFAKSLNNHSTMILDKTDWAGVRGVKVTNESVNEAKVFVHNEKTGEKYEVLSGKGKGDLLIAMKALEKSAPSHMKYSIKESVNEGVSSTDMDKIKGAVEAASSFMSVGSELKKLGMKYTFATEPLPIYIIQPTPNNKVAIVNKKYASKPDFVVGDIAVGIMEGKLNEEEIKWNAVENAIINFLKMNTKILDKRVQAKDTDGVKGGLKSIINGLVNAQRNLKLESVNEGVKLSLVDPNTNKFIKTLSLDRTYREAEKEVETLNRRLSPSEKTKGLYWKVTSIGESVNEAGYTVKAENPYQFVNGAYAVLSAYLRDEELGPKGKRELQDIIKSLEYMRKYFYFKLTESLNEEIAVGKMVKVDNPHWESALGKKGPFKRKVKMIDGDNVFFTDGSNSSMKYVKESVESVNEAKFKVLASFGGYDLIEAPTEKDMIISKNGKKVGKLTKTSKYLKDDIKSFINMVKSDKLGESVNEEKYTVIDPMGNQKGVGPKIQAISMAKRLGGEKTGHFVVANTNALKARRALEKFKGDFKNPKLKDMMMNLYYESVNERIVKEKVK
jgi:hypothetical protein